MERKNGRTFYEKYEFELCEDQMNTVTDNKDFLDRILTTHQLDWYDQPICFKNRDNVTLTKSWKHEEYSFPVISITYCKNTTNNGNWCKPREVIDEWLSRQISYFVSQDTIVMSHIREDHEIVS